MLPGVVRAIRVRGLRIPYDVSVIGSGQSDLSDLHQPPIGIVNWDQKEVGATAAEMLLDLIANGKRDEPRRVIISTTFNPQGSCMPPH